MTPNPAIEKAIKEAELGLSLIGWSDREWRRHILRTLAEAAYSAGERDGAARLASELGRSLVEGEKG